MNAVVVLCAVMLGAMLAGVLQNAALQNGAGRAAAIIVMLHAVVCSVVC